MRLHLREPGAIPTKAVERRFLERVIRAYRSGRRLRDIVHVIATGIVRTCKERRAAALAVERPHGECTHSAD